MVLFVLFVCLFYFVFVFVLFEFVSLFTCWPTSGGEHFPQYTTSRGFSAIAEPCTCVFDNSSVLVMMIDVCTQRVDVKVTSITGRFQHVMALLCSFHLHSPTTRSLQQVPVVGYRVTPKLLAIRNFDSAYTA